MTHDEAIDLIRPAVAGHDGDWADLGAGRGTFTAALAQLLDAGHTVTAVDRAATSLAQLRALAAGLPDHRGGDATVRVLAADLTDPTSLDTLATPSLAGVLLGNVTPLLCRAGAAAAGGGGEAGCWRCRRGVAGKGSTS